MNRRRTVVLGAVMALVCMIGIQALLVERWLLVLEQRNHQTQIRHDMLRLERLVADVDNGFRGYVLMNKSSFLLPMVSAEASIPTILEGLTRMTKTWPDLQGRVGMVQDRIMELVATKRRLTMEMTNGNEETVLRYIREGEGLTLTQTIALAFEELDQRIRKRQKEWDREHAQTLQWVRWGLPMTVIGGVLCGLTIGRITGSPAHSTWTDLPGAAADSREARSCTLV
jgi:CHASE3 domain sensor protein